MFKKNQKIGLSLLLMGLVLMGSFFYWKSSPPNPPVPLNQVVMAPVQVHNIPLTATVLGTLTAREETMLKAQQSGVITHLLFKNGQTVQKGALLVQLDDATEQAQYQNAAAALFQAQSQYQRYVKLNQEDPAVLSLLQMDQVKTTYQEALATLAEMKKSVNDMQIRAPFSGTLGSTFLSVGSYVNSGDDVVALVNLHHLEVVYTLPEPDYNQVQLGQLVTLTTDAFPGKTLTAHVDYRAPLIDSSSHSFTVRALLDDPQGLSPGMLMHVTHLLQAERPVLAVPTVSLISELSGFGVYTVQGGKVVEQYVQVGSASGNYTEITGGLKPGETVMIEGQNKVQPGESVIVSGS